MLCQQRFITKYLLSFAVGYNLSFIKNYNPFTQVSNQIQIMSGYNLCNRKTA